jgi:parallel beta-helix repeat protein
MLTHGRAGAAAPMTPATIYIDPDAPAGGDGSIAAPFNSWNVGALQAGTRYLQRAGTTASGLIAVTTAATAALPIVIGAYGSGKAPMFDGMVDFSGASHVTLTGFTLTSASGAAVIIQQGSSNIEVSGNSIVNANAGVWIGNGMGSHIAILHNTISGAAGNGIAVSGPSISAQPDIAIARNIISGSGADGIQISSNGIEVSGNSISASGLSTTGASGIQVYAGSATAGVGQGNIITGNVLVGNRDATGQDGNGVLLDQWTSGNQVSENFASGNDGAGIVLYDSGANTVTGNVVGDNAADSGGTHRIHADLSLYDTVGLTSRNAFSANVVLSFKAGGVAVSVTAQSMKAGNSFAGDVMENAAGGDVFDAGGRLGANASQWNRIMAAADHFSGVPLSPPAQGESFAYRFAARTYVALDGHTVHLVGWSAAIGLAGSS